VGALALTRPGFAVAVPLVGLAALLRHGPLLGRLTRVAVTAAAAAVLLVPWLAFTASATGSPVLSSFAAGWNLLIAAHGEGAHRTGGQVFEDPAYVRDFTSVQKLAPPVRRFAEVRDSHPHYLLRADRRLRRIALRLYRHRLRTEPLTVLGEIGFRAYALWRIHTDWFQPGNALALLVLRVVDWLTLLLAVVGAAVSFRARPPAAAFAIFLLVYTAEIALQHTEARYSVPLRGLLLLLAAAGLVRLADAVRARRAPA
jgi:hypothetical protein